MVLLRLAFLAGLLWLIVSGRPFLSFIAALVLVAGTAMGWWTDAPPRD